MYTIMKRNLVQVLEKLRATATLTLRKNKISRILIKLSMRILETKLETKISLISLVRDST